MPPVELWAYAFAWTLILEVPIVLLGTWRALGVPKSLATAVGLQVLTHPALWYVVPRFEPYLLWWACVEAGVTVVEGTVLSLVLVRAGQPRRAALARGFAVALAANLFSALAGFVLL